MNINLSSVGTLLAIVVGLLAVVFWALGRLDPIVAGLVIGLAIARVLP